LNFNVADAWFIFREKVNALCERYVPVKKSDNSKAKKSIWMSKRTIKTIKKRNTTWNKYKKDNSDVNYKQYKDLLNKVVKFIRRDKSDYQHNLIRGFQYNPKRFYFIVTCEEQEQSKVKCNISSGKMVI